MLYYSAMKTNFISADTAMELARRVLHDNFDEQAEEQEPLTVRAEDENWIVEGRELAPVPKMPLALNIDRRFVMVIAQFDGQIKDIVFNGPPIKPTP